MTTPTLAPPANCSIDELLRFLSAQARTYPTARAFASAYNQAHLIDLSDRDAHRVGRAIRWHPESPDGVATLDIATVRRGRQDEVGVGPRAKNAPLYRFEAAALYGTSSTVTIYRGVPRGVTTIDIGDFVTLDPEYARGSGATNNAHFAVISRTVPVTDVIFGDNDAKEWVYAPLALRETAVSLVTIWERAQ